MATKAKKKSTAVAKKEDSAIANADLLKRLEGLGEEYRESLGQDDISIPFLQLLQSMSPQVKKGRPEYIKEAEESMVINTLTKDLYQTQDDDGNPVHELTVIPLAYSTYFVEWVPRANGGGFVAQYTVAEGMKAKTFRNDKSKDIILEGSPIGTPGNELAFTHTHFVFILGEDGQVTPAVVSMTSTQLKSSKNWNALINGQRLPGSAKRPPRFFGIWGVSTRRRSNTQGDWHVWSFEKVSDVLSLPPEQAAYILDEATAFVEGVQSGEHKADFSKVEPEESATVNPESVDDEGVPF